MKRLVFSGLLILTALTNFCGAFPVPTWLGTASEWTLDVEYSQPRQIEVKLPGSETPQRYWYIILTLVNRTGKDVDFFPECTLVTDTFEVLEANVDINTIVFNRIFKLHEGRYPFLQPIELADSVLLQGEDNAVDLAIIWPDFDPDAKNITLFVQGLSNQTAVIEHPTDTDENGDPVKIYLSKTLGLEYAIPGDPMFRSDARLEYMDTIWVFR